MLNYPETLLWSHLEYDGELMTSLYNSFVSDAQYKKQLTEYHLIIWGIKTLAKTGVKYIYTYKKKILLN